MLAYLEAARCKQDNLLATEKHGWSSLRLQCLALTHLNAPAHFHNLIYLGTGPGLDNQLTH